MPETGIEQVQDSMLGTAHVEVYRHPVAFKRGVKRCLGIVGIKEAEIIPAGPCPLRHNVRFPCGNAAIGECYL